MSQFRVKNSIGEYNEETRFDVVVELRETPSAEDYKKITQAIEDLYEVVDRIKKDITIYTDK